MAASFRSSRRDRIASAVLAGVIQLALGVALLRGLGFSLPESVREQLTVFDLARPPDPPPPPERQQVEQPKQAARKEGEAAPANIRSKPTNVVAPPPVVPLPVTPPIPTAPVADTGRDATAGASDRYGPGTGAGGFGNGRGSGGDGDGDGGGGTETPPRRIGGRLSPTDYEREPGDFARRRVYVRYTVEEDGRVGACRVQRGSGDPRLDSIICPLIRQRFRFRPSLDEDGRPVSADIEEFHEFLPRGDRPDEGD